MSNDSSISVRFAGRLGGLRHNPRKGFGSMSPDRLREIARAGALRRWSLSRSRTAINSLSSDYGDLFAGAGAALAPVKADIPQTVCSGSPS